MDQHHAQLLTAAQALRTWVHAQRATWTEESGVDFTALRTLSRAPAPDPLSFAPSFAPALAPAYSPEASCQRSSEPVAPAPPHRSVDRALQLGSALRALAGLGTRGARQVVRFWQPLLAVVVVLLGVWSARAYGPGWARAMKVRLAAAGEHTTVFDRRATTAAPSAAAPGKSGERAAGALRRAGRVQVDSNPAGAHVLVDGRDRGVTPLTLPDLAIGAHTVVLTGDGGSVRRNIVVAGDKTTQVNEAIYSGWLHVSSPIELQISEDERGIRLDDSNQVLLPPGPHKVRLENRMFGFVEVRTIDVKPGDTTSMSVEPPASRLSITASTAAEVLVDGALVGGTPLTDYALPLGTREVTVRNAAGAERRTMVTVTVEPIRLHVDFSKP